MLTARALIADGYWLWLIFLVSWWLAAAWTAKASARAARRQRILYFLGYAIAFALLFVRSPMVPALWPTPPAVAAALLIAELAGFLFAWWARLHLGRLWSGMLTLREGHRIVDSGPYALVRHPIYTGYIWSAWALAVATALPTALIGAALLTIVMRVKAGTEERLLESFFGPASYEAYRRRVPMLLPYS